MVQVQVLNGVPSMNIYGQYSMIDGFNFKDINRKGIYGYWDHMDYIIKSAASRGIYIGMVCIWGTPVEQGLMNEKKPWHTVNFLRNVTRMSRILFG